MKIALIRRRFSASGGAELYTQRLLAGLLSRGHETHLFAEHWDVTEPGIKFHAVQSGGFRSIQAVRFAESVASALGQFEMDCVLSLERTIHQDIYRAGDGVHNVWLDRRRTFAPWWKRPFVGRGAFHRNMLQIEKRAFDPKNTRCVIVNSEMVKNEIVREFDYPTESIHLIRNGVDTSRFSGRDKHAARERFGVNKEEFLIAFVGSGWERKGLMFVFDALNTPALRGMARLIVAGKGKVPRNASKNTIFTGPIGEVEDVYAAADLFVTLPIYEPAANVVSEALAAGLPVITSIQNGASELLQDGRTGSIVPDPSDLNEVASRIRYWMDMGGAAGRAPCDVAALDIRRNVDETVALLEHVAAEKLSRL
jgi:UDP-glucose:(heptosyl)LPS alpha-1,3-glucosyltransferase